MQLVCINLLRCTRRTIGEHLFDAIPLYAKQPPVPTLPADIDVLYLHHFAAGLEAARARGRKGGRKFALSKAQVRLAQAAMANRDVSVSELCTELDIKPVTLYRYVDPQGQLREQGRNVLLDR